MAMSPETLFDRVVHLNLWGVPSSLSPLSLFPFLLIVRWGRVSRPVDNASIVPVVTLPPRFVQILLHQWLAAAMICVALV